MADGCPECDWNGEVAVTNTYTHEYYTHVIINEGEVFEGKTCSTRTRPARGILSQIAQRL